MKVVGRARRFGGGVDVVGVDVAGGRALGTGGGHDGCCGRKSEPSSALLLLSQAGGGHDGCCDRKAAAAMAGCSAVGPLPHALQFCEVSGRCPAVGRRPLLFEKAAWTAFRRFSPLPFGCPPLIAFRRSSPLPAMRLCVGPCSLPSAAPSLPPIGCPPLIAFGRSLHLTVGRRSLPLPVGCCPSFCSVVSRAGGGCFGCCGRRSPGGGGPGGCCGRGFNGTAIGRALCNTALELDMAQQLSCSTSQTLTAVTNKTMSI